MSWEENIPWSKIPDSLEMKNIHWTNLYIINIFHGKSKYHLNAKLTVHSVIHSYGFI